MALLFYYSVHFLTSVLITYNAAPLCLWLYGRRILPDDSLSSLKPEDKPYVIEVDQE
jgi:hypothetical protein